MISRSGVPMGSSRQIRLATDPLTENSLLPAPSGLRARPLNHAAPLAMMAGTLASVSTLLTTVGPFHKPFTAGNGGFILGFGRFPSSALMSAVSSPQM